ncbi:MAG: nuclear transport factor 2 family protein [Paracoccus sp. (in: a-proteobacteria)]|nr:nuclear transport factor 2 family protein [Paracoccus sp. (in: a-proteobacteria)]
MRDREPDGPDGPDDAVQDVAFTPAADAERIVRAFLAAMEARDLDAARQWLAPDFTMQFPGSPEMTELEQLVAFGSSRYRFVHKTFCAFDSCGQESRTVVICNGWLSGEWPDGSAFKGIRFIDRFELRGGLLLRQDVWNDLALVRC